MVTELGIDQNIDEFEKVGKLQQLYHLARDKKRYHYELWRRNYMLVHSRMWNTFPTTWTPTPTDNEIYPCLSGVVSWMTDQAIEFNVAPVSEPGTPQFDVGQKLSNDLKVCLDANWHEYNWPMQIKLAIWDSTIYGTGIIKSAWDSSLERGTGNVQLVRIDPWTIYPDPNGTSFDDCQYVIEVKKLSSDELERRFPEHYHLVRRGGYDSTEGDMDARPSIVNTSQFPLANPGAISPATSNSYGLPGQSRRSAVVEPGYFIYECWYKENQEGSVTTEDRDTGKIETESVVYDKWRIAIMCQGTILMDEFAEDLYGIDRQPYSRFCYEDLGEFWGVALATHIAPCQIAINRLLASLQQNAELCGNPIFISPSGAGISRTSIVNRPGTRLEISGSTPQGLRPDWLRPPDMSQQVPQLIEFWIQRMENIAGISNINKGQPPPPRTAARQTNQAQESGFVRIRAAQHNLESCLKDAGTVLATLIVQNYTVPRLVALTADQQNSQILKIIGKHFYMPDDKGNMLPIHFTLEVDAGADQPTSRHARISEADTLFAMGAIDQEAVLEMHNFPNRAIVKQRMDQQKAEMAAMGIEEQGPGKRVRARRTS